MSTFSFSFFLCFLSRSISSLVKFTSVIVMHQQILQKDGQTLFTDGEQLSIYNSEFWRHRRGTSLPMTWYVVWYNMTEITLEYTWFACSNSNSVQKICGSLSYKQLCIENVWQFIILSFILDLWILSYTHTPTFNFRKWVKLPFESHF